MEASLKLQKAYRKAIKTAGYGVYDYRPKKAPYPFVIIGDDTQSDLDVKNGEYIRITSTMLVFSKYRGQKEVKTIMEKLRQITHGIKIEGFSVVGIKVLNMMTTEEPDTELTQGIFEVEIKLLKGE